LQVDLVLLDRQGGVAAEAVAELFIASDRCDFVVISDIDDTVMMTGVGRKLVMMWRLFFNRAHSRVAFPGVTDFYRALYRGPDGEARNPMIYVSRAPWSIYEVLDEFFNAHGIPDGPILFLREWGLTLQHPLPKRARDHKRDQIDHIIDLYDGRRIVLIGDSGQRDPEVYAEIARHHPDRVAAIYIRDIGREGKHQPRIEALSAGMASGIDMVLASSTADMAAHAARIGLIEGPRGGKARADGGATAAG
jgi:phosphatidate phosphatase APP1